MPYILGGSFQNSHKYLLDPSSQNLKTKLLKRKGGRVSSDSREMSAGGKLSKAGSVFFLHLMCQRFLLENNKAHRLSRTNKWIAHIHLFNKFGTPASSVITLLVVSTLCTYCMPWFFFFFFEGK